jgi:hypothetical protein
MQLQRERSLAMQGRRDSHGGERMFSTITCHVLTASASLASALQTPSWEGRVSAVFRTSLQLIGPAETLMHLHGGPYLVSPFSLRIADSLTEYLQEDRFAVGRAVLKQGSDLVIDGRVRLSLDFTRYYHSPPLPMRPLDPESLSLARQILRRGGHPSGLALIPGAEEILADLQRSLAAADAEPLLASSQRIIGLGPGLTPSGDDVLVGCLKGLWLCAGSEFHVPTTIESLRHALLPMLHERTTRVGATFIRHALYGQFAEVLDRAATALLTPTNSNTVISALTGLLAQGATSGADTALGLLLCLEILTHGRHGARLGMSRKPSVFPRPLTTPCHHE